MADIRYFCDLGAEPVTLTRITTMRRTEAAARWPTVKLLRRDSFDVVVGQVAPGAEVLPATRKVEFKRRAAGPHECNAKCMGACGKSMVCECRCGGKNHGRSVT